MTNAGPHALMAGVSGLINYCLAARCAVYFTALAGMVGGGATVGWINPAGEQVKAMATPTAALQRHIPAYRGD